MTNIDFLRLERKSPTEVENYVIDWSDYLATGETVATSSFTADSGITIDSSSIITGNTSTKARLSGGTLNKLHRVTNTVVTSLPRTLSLSLGISIINK